MCLLNFVLFFKINYKCHYGEAVYVIGSIDQLGNWNPAQALKLEWTEGDNWVQKLKVIHENTKLIEYKYAVAPSTFLFPVTNIRWEAGPNRCINLVHFLSLAINLNDTWEYIKVKIALHYETIKSSLEGGKRIILYTKVDNSKQKHEMKLERNILDDETKEDWFWVSSFLLPNCITSFSYKYKIEGDCIGQAISDRRERKFSLNKFTEPALLADELYSIRSNTLTKFDFNFKTSVSYDVVTENILVGSFPQDQKDVNDMAGLGIKGVLNLQTFDDMRRFGIDWQLIQSYYKQADISLIHFPIPDMNIEELSLKMHDAAKLLNTLLKQGKVYVHCTAGKFRSPHIIICYLCSYQGYTLEQAMKLMRSKRAEFRMIKDVFSEKHEEAPKGTIIK